MLIKLLYLKKSEDGREVGGRGVEELGVVILTMMVQSSEELAMTWSL